MKFWKIFGFASGILLITMFAKKHRERSCYTDVLEKRYDTEDLITDQEL
ncbi:MAG: hypothetical protein HZB59_07700 [Ignavibacteriales bacterium]|nr:hypothetical protein [Ignavibacteriales bacterium]